MEVTVAALQPVRGDIRCEPEIEYPANWQSAAEAAFEDYRIKVRFLLSVDCNRWFRAITTSATQCSLSHISTEATREERESISGVIAVFTVDHRSITFIQRTGSFDVFPILHKSTVMHSLRRIFTFPLTLFELVGRL